MSTVKSVSGSRAKELIELKDAKLRIFYIGSVWCSACQEMGIQVGIAASEVGRYATFHKIDFDSNENWLTKYMKADKDGVSIPYLLFRRKGKSIKHIEGYEDAEEIVEAVEEVL